MTYFLLLPSDLILEQSLYLNYPETEQYCLVLQRKTCDSIWQYKIKKELKYELPETVIPWSLKYLELKSIVGVDFGTEYFKDFNTIFMRAVRVKDKILRKELLTYFFNIIDRRRVDDAIYREWLENVIVGTIAMNDHDLYEFYLNKAKDNKIYSYMNTLEVYGYAERGLDQLAKEMNLSDLWKSDYLVSKGFARGGHLELLKKYLPDLNTGEFNSVLREAAQYNQEAVVEYLVTLSRSDPSKYPSFTTDFCYSLIEYNRPDFSWYVMNLLYNEPWSDMYNLILPAARSGLVSLLKKLFSVKIGQSNESPHNLISEVVIDWSFQNNHLDTTLFLLDIKPKTKEFYISPDYYPNATVVKLAYEYKVINMLSFLKILRLPNISKKDREQLEISRK